MQGVSKDDAVGNRWYTSQFKTETAALPEARGTATFATSSLGDCGGIDSHD